jgi:hypothetical protein
MTRAKLEEWTLSNLNNKLNAIKRQSNIYIKVVWNQQGLALEKGLTTEVDYSWHHRQLTL